MIAVSVEILRLHMHFVGLSCKGNYGAYLVHILKRPNVCVIEVIHIILDRDTNTKATRQQDV